EMRYFWCFGTARRSSRFNPFIHFCRFSPKSAKTEEFFKNSSDFLTGLDPQVLGNWSAAHFISIGFCNTTVVLQIGIQLPIWGGMSTAEPTHCLIRLVTILRKASILRKPP